MITLFGFEAQSLSQTAMIRLMETRLAEVQRFMGESVTGSSMRTARSLGDLHLRLEVIYKAQANIEKLSGNVLSLQDNLANKQTRGAFGEIQLHDIVAKARLGPGVALADAGNVVAVAARAGPVRGARAFGRRLAPRL